ncbi:hypothetical protein [Cardinium endosymbiont of Oedothorax gibbosus]|uniref:hypothetical protein n=1 Tax=Cardinium endosymbiont of Oedothorax gibbosus TaxID=931101 RepID=UPI002025410B|nr:hypothetical protein [Cardinium endosymbiont of Oedothorax gibbosus]
MLLNTPFLNEKYLITTTYMDLMDRKTVTILSTLVLIVYATLGGIRSVTNTDVWQFITFIAIIFLIAKLMFIKTGKSVLEIVSLLQKQAKFQLSSLCHSNGQLLHLLLFIPFPFSEVSDCRTIHRVYMCSGPIETKKVFLYSSFCHLIIVSFICIMGLFVFVGDAMLPVAEIWNYIIT